MGLAQKKQTLKSRREPAAAGDQTQTSTSTSEAHNGDELVERYEAGVDLRKRRDAIMAAATSDIPKRAKGEVTSPELAKLAAVYINVDHQYVKNAVLAPAALSQFVTGIRKLAASVLAQAPDHV